MNPDSENFESLRQLLALKRHEIPPPGYFNRFSRDVIARIKAGDDGGVIGYESSWWQRLVSMFDLKPVFAGAFGTAVCAFLVSGLISSEPPSAVGRVTTNPDNGSLAGIPNDGSAALATQVSSTSSNSIAAGGSLFDQFSPQAPLASDRFYLTPAPNN